MALTRENPLSIEAVGSIEVDLEGQVKEIAAKIEDADNARSSWLEKQRRFFNQRRGIRAPKTIPWPGCNNDSWPLTNAVIRRWKPSMANLVLRSNPVCLFEALNPESSDASRAAQQYYHWLFTSHVDHSALTVMELVDLVAQFGKAYTRQGWHYETERHSRVVRIDSLFPQGIEPALDAVNQQIAQANEQLPDEQKQPELSAAQFIQMVLAQEYRLNPQRQDEAQMLQAASERVLQGARYVRLVYQSVLHDKPAWRALSPLDVIRPVRSESIDNDDFVCLVHRFTADDIARKAKDGFFHPQQAAAVAERITKQSSHADSSHDMGFRRQSLLDAYNAASGVDQQWKDGSPTAEVWEIYTKIDIDGDGINERAVIWYHAPSKHVLAAFEYPYPFREWPIAEFSFEYNDANPYSARGIAELLTVHQKLVNSLHNSRLDALQILGAPAFKVRSIGNHFSRNVKFRPGARIPVTDPNDFMPIQMDFRPLTEFLREEQVTKTFAEQYIGIFDPSLTQIQGSGRERRTATEVDAVVAQASEVMAQDAQLFQLAMAKVHRQIWDLWEEFGQEELYFRVLGEEQPKLARKHEISGDYDLVPAGSPISTNRAIILNRAREMIQLFVQDPSMIVDKYELFKEYFQSHDFALAKRMLRAPEELEILQQAQAQMAQVTQDMASK